MRLYIIRHGQAEARAASGRDSDRQLTALGQHQATWLGEQVLAREDRPRLILHSPFVRAAHTARLICGLVGCEMRVHDSLICDSPASAGVDLIVEYAQHGPLAFVGHNPQLDHLVGILIGGHGQSMGIRTGEAVLLHVDFANPTSPGTAPERLRLDG